MIKKRNHSLADFNHTTSRSLSKKRGILEAAATLLSAVLTKLQQTAQLSGELIALKQQPHACSMVSHSCAAAKLCYISNMLKKSISYERNLQATGQVESKADD